MGSLSWTKAAELKPTKVFVWDEAEHPRDDDGKFTDSDGGQEDDGDARPSRSRHKPVDVSGFIETRPEGFTIPGGDKYITDETIMRSVAKYSEEIDRFAMRQTWTEKEVRLLTGDSTNKDTPQYEFLCDYLRGVGSGVYPKQALDDAVRTLDAKFKDPKAKLDEEVVTYRGVQTSGTYALPKLKVGSIYNDKGYVIATLDPLYAVGFTTAKLGHEGDRGKRIVATKVRGGNLNWDSENRILFKITAPKGKSIIAAPTKKNAPKALRSGRRVTNREAAFVFPRNSKFKVTKITKGSPKTAGATLVEMELL